MDPGLHCIQDARRRLKLLSTNHTQLHLFSHRQRYSGSQALQFMSRRWAAVSEVCLPPTPDICPSALGITCVLVCREAFLLPCLASTVLSTHSWYHPDMIHDCYAVQTFLQLFVNSLYSGGHSQTFFFFTLSNHTILPSLFFSPSLLLFIFFPLPLL